MAHGKYKIIFVKAKGATCQASNNCAILSASLPVQIIVFSLVLQTTLQSVPSLPPSLPFLPTWVFFLFFFSSSAQVASRTQQVPNNQQILREHVLLTAGFFFLAHSTPYSPNCTNKCLLKTLTGLQPSQFLSLQLCSSAQYNRLLTGKHRGRHFLTQ